MTNVNTESIAAIIQNIVYERFIYDHVFNKMYPVYKKCCKMEHEIMNFSVSTKSKCPLCLKYINTTSMSGHILKCIEKK